MKMNEFGFLHRQEMMEAMRSAIDNHKGIYVTLQNLHKVLESLNAGMPGYLVSPQGRTALRECIGMLLEEELLEPVGRKPDTADGLFSKYRIHVNRNRKQEREGFAEQIINTIVSPARVEYYLKNPEVWVEDREAISAISGFLKGTAANTANMVTVNERSYELFGDEKFLTGAERERSRGLSILRRLGIGYAELGCFETSEPFFSFLSDQFHSTQHRTIFIIENKDTFWSFKRYLREGFAEQGKQEGKLDMLVYGEGKKIISSFQFMKEYRVVPKVDDIFYFGDLDAEGINIFCELASGFPEYGIRPFTDGYLEILEIGTGKGLRRTPKHQIVDLANIRHFTSFFEGEIAERIEKILCQGNYIPQEAITGDKIGKLLETGKLTR